MSDKKYSDGINRNFDIRDERSIIVLTPKTVKAKKWVKDYLFYEDYQKIGDGIIIERRFFINILSFLHKSFK